MPLAAWLNDLNARLSFLQNWIDDGIPIVFWISGFFFPQAFLTGSLQNFARRYQKPVDGISFSFKVQKTARENIKEKPEDGCYIYGLFLQGCQWDEEMESLVDFKPKVLFTSFPVLHLDPEENKKASGEGIYRCPCYKTLDRRGVLMTTGHSTNFVTFIEVPTKVDSSKWIKAGVALFCALKY